MHGPINVVFVCHHGTGRSRAFKQALEKYLKLVGMDREFNVERAGTHGERSETIHNAHHIFPCFHPEEEYLRKMGRELVPGRIHPEIHLMSPYDSRIGPKLLKLIRNE